MGLLGSAMGRGLAGLGQGAVQLADKYVDQEIRQQNAYVDAQLQLAKEKFLAEMRERHKIAAEERELSPERQGRMLEIRRGELQNELDFKSDPENIEKTVSAQNSLSAGTLEADTERARAVQRAKEEGSVHNVGLGAKAVYGSGEVVADNASGLIDGARTRGAEARSSQADGKEWLAAQKEVLPYVSINDPLTGDARENMDARSLMQADMNRLRSEGADPYDAATAVGNKLMLLRQRAEARAKAEPELSMDAALSAEIRAYAAARNKAMGGGKPAAAPATPNADRDAKPADETAQQSKAADKPARIQFTASGPYAQQINAVERAMQSVLDSLGPDATIEQRTRASEQMRVLQSQLDRLKKQREER